MPELELSPFTVYEKQYFDFTLRLVVHDKDNIHAYIHNDDDTYEDYEVESVTMLDDDFIIKYKE